MKLKRSLLAVALMSTLIISGCSNDSFPSSVDPGEESTSSSSEPSRESSGDAKSSSSSSSSSSSASSSSSDASSSSSSSSSSSQAPQYLKKDVVVQLDSFFKKGDNIAPYDLTFSYDDELFLKSAKTYDKTLSELSLGASIATSNRTKGDAFYTAIGFKDLYTHDYDKTPSKDTMGYYIAHRAIDNYELVTVAFRGFEYGLEWANNFTIGKTGNHEGFNARGVEAYQELQSYIAKNCANKSLKLWINGYSRAGAVSQVLASLVLTGDKVAVTQDDMFVYTFEAPAALDEENAIHYENVHSIVNEGDLVAAVPPATYGLYRCGTEYQIYDINVATLMKEFDQDVTFPEFKVIDDISGVDPMTTDGQVLDYISNSVFNKEISDPSNTEVYANTREQYVDNYQAGLSASLGYIFGLSDATRSALLADLTSKDMWSLVGIVFDETGKGLADFLSPYLDRDHITYDAEELQANCAVVTKAAINLFPAVLAMYAGSYKDSLMRLINMHYPETTYVLLKNAHAKA